MLDRAYLREYPEIVRGAFLRRGDEYPQLVDRFLKVDEERRTAQTGLDKLRSEHNAASKEIGALPKADKRKEGEEAKSQAFIRLAPFIKDIKAQIEKLQKEYNDLNATEYQLLLSMPNMPHDSVPVGGEAAAEIVKEWGELKEFGFTPLNHVELCAKLRLVNFEAGARLAGSGFPVMLGAGAHLQRALINLMLDVHTGKHGYTEVRPPFIVHPRCAIGTGQLPKFGADMYHVYIEGAPEPEPSSTADAEGQAGNGPHYYLIPTAEVPLCNYYREQILDAPALPIKLCAYSPCWRVEGGHYGKEARGLTRVHQFEKVELVRISEPERSYDELEEITAEAEYILELLGLAYRRKVLPSGDMAFPSAKTYDLEVHCPADGAWREVASASNTTDYQARRADIRYRPAPGEKPRFPHLLNASGLALPRLVIALLETCQTPEGNVAIPEALKTYMPGITEITAPDNGAPFI
ncbi:serine--tRNA ligase [bacterium]|nr:serine--tRNA ligase [bacterium]